MRLMQGLTHVERLRSYAEDVQKFRQDHSELDAPKSPPKSEPPRPNNTQDVPKSDDATRR